MGRKRVGWWEWKRRCSSKATCHKLDVTRRAMPLAQDQVRVKAQTLFREAWDQFQSEQWHQGEVSVKTALPLWRQLKDPYWTAMTAYSIGYSLDKQRQATGALAAFRESAQIRRQIGDRSGLIRSLNYMGELSQRLGRGAEALGHYQEVLVLSRAVRDRGFEAGALLDIGSTLETLARYEAGLRYAQAALPIFRAVQDEQGEAAALSTIGGIQYRLGNRRESLRFYEFALAKVRKIKAKTGEAFILSNLGYIHEYSGEFEAALQYFERNLTVYRKLGDKEGEAKCAANINRMKWKLKQQLKAVEDIRPRASW
ncbi:tetratricopeptide repeat protein [bacterium]|nr:MAG: tetratricopeptide repeat protein [bacterium]